MTDWPHRLVCDWVVFEADDHGYVKVSTAGGSTDLMGPDEVRQLHKWLGVVLYE